MTIVRLIAPDGGKTTDGSNVTSYYLSDGLGSTTQLTDNAGTQTDTYTYDVFGAPRTVTGTTANDFRFTGQQDDVNASRGLYYLRARAYDPTLGRFLGKDPLALGNRYAYVGNNPANLIDPSGLCGWRHPLDCAAKAGDAAAGAGEVAWDKAVQYGGGAIVYPLYQLGKLETALLQTDCGGLVLNLATYAAYVPNPYAQSVGYTAITLDFVVNAPADAKEGDWFSAGLSTADFLSAIGERLAATATQRRAISAVGIHTSSASTIKALDECMR